MADPLLEARGIVKTFGRVHALRGANFTACPGEIVAMIGDNGAGKSPLATCLSGVYQPDAGQILLEGRPVHVTSPLTALHLGIETVYQDLALADDLEPAANLFLGHPDRSVVDHQGQRERDVPVLLQGWPLAQAKNRSQPNRRVRRAPSPRRRTGYASGLPTPPPMPAAGRPWWHGCRGRG